MQIDPPASDAPLPFWQIPAWQRFTERAERGRLPHALLLSAVPGLDSASFTARIAASVLCHQRRADWQACGHCRACLARQADSHADYYEVRTLEKKASIGVDQIRALASDLALTPQSGDWQVAVIFAADLMTTAAANALLKTLEEPSAQTLIVLQTEHVGALLPTILSRCQKIPMHVPERDAALAWLSENASAPHAAIDTALFLAQGAPALALAMIDDASVARYSELERDLDALPGTRAKLAKRWSDQISEFVRLSNHWLRAQMQRAAKAQARARLQQLNELYQRLQRIDAWQGTGVRLDLALIDWLARVSSEGLRP